MIIWLNGTFGAGKSTTARELIPLMPDSRLFDPELVGYVLMEYLSDHEFSDFQDLTPWRTLVPIVTNQVALVHRPAPDRDAVRPERGLLGRASAGLPPSFAGHLPRRAACGARRAQREDQG